MTSGPTRRVLQGLGGRESVMASPTGHDLLYTLRRGRGARASFIAEKTGGEDVLSKSRGRCPRG